jgi:hypothetical protein
MTTKNSNQKDGFNHQASLILPFVPEDPEASKLTKDNSMTLELRSNPTDQDSAKVKYNVRIVSGTETPREILHWVHDLTNQVFPGLGLGLPTSGPGQKAILQTLTTGNTFQIVKVNNETQAQAVRAYRANTANVDPTNAAHMAIMATPLDHEENMTPNVITDTLNQVIDSMMPRHALQRVQRYLQREYRKPTDMRVRDYYQHLVLSTLRSSPGFHLLGQDPNSGSTMPT